MTRTVDVLAKQEIPHRWRPRPSVVLREERVKDLAADARSPYGGWNDRRGKGTGFFRVERDAEGRWWLMDPDGHPFVSVGVNAVRPNDTKRGHTRMREKFGSVEAWANDAAQLLQQNGFNSLGAWSYWESIGAGAHRLPYTMMLNFMARYSKSLGQSSQGTGHLDYPDNVIPLFDPGFEAYCRKEAGKLKSSRDDPWLIGRFSDNELPFPADLLDRFLRRPETDAGRAAAAAWLADQKAEGNAIDDATRARFLAFAAERYFRICREAIQANDPNHLYLGCRFHEKVLWREPVFRAAAKHLDVISINWYGQWTPDRETMDHWQAWSDRPFLVSEFFAKAMDSGLGNTSGAGWIVETQEARGLFYQNFAWPLLRHPGCVGWHWFRYLDNDPEDPPSDPTNRDANKGIVNGQFTPYAKLLDAMSVLNRRVYRLRAQDGPAAEK